MSELYKLSIKEKLEGLKSKQFSSVEITQTYLDRIKLLDKDLNSYITVTEDLALEKAKESDLRYQEKNHLPLDGIPIAHKDIFCTQNTLTTCGSKMLNNFIPPYSSTVVEKLDDAGLVSLGKTNMDEFAMGSSNETSFYGEVKNPWDKEYVPGGSSGGSATSVAAGLCSAATATDTGGSIRQPASLCGLTGIKPTYGRVSRYGMIAFASSLDQGGVLAKSSEDVAHILSYMSGNDPKDSTSLAEEVPNFVEDLKNTLNGTRIGIPKQFMSHNLPDYIEKNLQDTKQELEKLGASFYEIDLPNLDLSLPIYYILAPAECSANLSRYDGVKFGYRCENPKDLDDLYLRTRKEGFGDEVKRRILIGTYALSAGFYDAYYLKAQQCRRLVAQDFEKAFQEVDLIFSPTTPGTAFKAGDKIDDPLEMYLQDIFTIPANLAGLPAISFPTGFHNGLPLGMQLVSNKLQESKLLSSCYQFQKVTDYHKKWPSQ